MSSDDVSVPSTNRSKLWSTPPPPPPHPAIRRADIAANEKVRNLIASPDRVSGYMTMKAQRRFVGVFADGCSSGVGDPVVFGYRHLALACHPGSELAN